MSVFLFLARIEKLGQSAPAGATFEVFQIYP